MLINGSYSSCFLWSSWKFLAYLPILGFKVLININYNNTLIL